MGTDNAAKQPEATMDYSPATRQFGHDEFDDIERAVMETTRGRWFLAEFARRIRSAETRQVLETLGRVEELLLKPNVRNQTPMLAKSADEAPVDALMQRLQSAISAMSCPTPKHVEIHPDDVKATDAAPQTLVSLDALSPADRLKLFY